VAVQDLHEAGHVSALEIVRQVHVHVEVRDRVLLAAGTVLHLDGVENVLDSDLVDRDPPGIGMPCTSSTGFTFGFLTGTAAFMGGFLLGRSADVWCLNRGFQEF